MSSDELEEKWLKNTLSDEEKQIYNNLEDAVFNKHIVNSAKHFKASNFINFRDFNSFKSFYNTTKAIKKTDWYNNPFLKVACILVIAFGVYFSLFYNATTQVKTLASQIQTIQLPDHSQVTLNALTCIEFNKKNWQETREIKLKGEAYFKVAKGKKFDVITKQGVVSVVGTQFNVKERQNYFEVKCFEGVVQVKSKNITRLLKPGDTYKVLYGKFLEGKTTAILPAWTKNRSVFESIPIKEVFAELERQYNVKVKYTLNSNRFFTGVFVHDNLENALLSITQPMNLTFEMNDSNLIVIHEKKD